MLYIKMEINKKYGQLYVLDNEKAKYCYKGNDFAFIEVCNIVVNFKEDSDMKHINENNEDEYEYDEIKQYINTRYICSPETMYI